MCVYIYVVVQSLNRVQLYAAPWTAARQASLSSTLSWSLLKFMSIESVMLSNHLILCRPLLLGLLSQHQGLVQWDGSSYQVAEVLEHQLWHQLMLETLFNLQYSFTYHFATFASSPSSPLLLLLSLPLLYSRSQQIFLSTYDMLGSTNFTSHNFFYDLIKKHIFIQLSLQ